MADVFIILDGGLVQDVSVVGDGCVKNVYVIDQDIEGCDSEDVITITTGKGKNKNEYSAYVRSYSYRDNVDEDVEKVVKKFIKMMKE